MNASILDGSPEEKILASANAGFKAIELRVAYSQPADKGKEILDAPGAVRLRKILDDNGMVVAAGYKLQGWFELDGGLMGVQDDWRAILEECERRMEIAAILGAPGIICAPSYSHRGRSAEVHDAAERYAQLVELGRRFQVKPILEYLGQTAQINTLGSCVKFLDSVDRTLPFVLDNFHIWRGGGSLEELDRIEVQRIGLVHISDADPKIKRQLHKDSERLWPGDGFLDVAHFLAKLRGTFSYAGYISIATFKFLGSRTDPTSLAAEAMRRLEFA